MTLVILALVLMSTAQSQNARFWNGSDNNNWRNNDNWSNGNTPTANQLAIMDRGVGRNNVDLSNSSGDDRDREVFSIRFRHNGNDTTIDDYFGPNQDLDANWFLNRGTLVIPENSAITGVPQVTWVDTRSGRNSTTVLADIDLTASPVQFSGEGEDGFNGSAGGTDSTEILNFYGSLSGNSMIRIISTFDSSADYKSRLVLHEDNLFFGGIFRVSSSGELYLRHPSALRNASVQLESGGVLNFDGTDVTLDDLINESTINVAGQRLTFLSREARTNGGTFTGNGMIRFFGNDTWTSTADNPFTGTVTAAGGAAFIAGAQNSWANALIEMQTDEGFAFTPDEATIGGLSGSGDITLAANKILTLGSSAFDATYSGDLLGTGELIQDNGTDWTFNGTADASIVVRSGTFSGTGTMSGVSLDPDGRISPGASSAIGAIGTQSFSVLSVQGTMDVDVNSAGQADQFVVRGGQGGSLQLDGATLNIRADAFPSDAPVIIATYAELIGTFDEINGLPEDVVIDYAWNNGTQIALFELQPMAVDDEYTLNEDTTLSGQSFLDNDVVANIDDWFIAGTDPPEAGSIPFGLSVSGQNFEFAPAADRFGTARVTYRARNENTGEVISATATFNVLPVNDAPSFSATDPAAVDQDAGPQTISGWAVFNPGPREGDQSVLAYSVSNISNMSLFAVAPAVDTNGNLSFAPAEGITGSSTFDVIVQDNGGTDNGGVDTSVPQTFQISVNNVLPVAVDDAFSMDEDSILSGVNVLTNDEDSPSDTLSLVEPVTSLVGGSDQVFGEVTRSANGDLTFDPESDDFGTVSFEYTVQDSAGERDTGTVTITVRAVNDAPTFSASDLPAIEQNAGAQEILAWAGFDPGADNESDQSVLEYVVANISNTALFDIAPSIDTNGNLRFTPASDVSGSSTFDVIVRDNGGTDNGGVDTSLPQTFQITINGINAAPSFEATDPPAINEDAGQQVISSWATFDPGSPDELGQSVLAYTVTEIGNADLFDALPVIDTNGNLSYTPATDAFGESTFVVTVQDDGGTDNGGEDTSSPQTFTIRVNPVNDAPSFSASLMLSINEDAGAQTIANWATFDPGPDNESDQTVLGYEVSQIGNSSLFAVEPAVDVNGTLTYTPADDANGTTTFDVLVQDSGGTDNGGQDRSSANRFELTINPVNDPPTYTDIGDVNILATEDGDLIWAENISPGPADESDQMVMFSITNVTNPAMFAELPTIDSAGRLTFTLDTAVQGGVLSEVTVVAVDDGGEDNGGDPSADPVTFTIRVVSVADLSIDKTSGAVFADEGGTMIYTIVVSNSGPSEAMDAVVIDIPPERLSNVIWACEPVGEATCETSSGTDDIETMVSLAANSLTIFTLTGTLNDSTFEPITNVATVVEPLDVVDPNLSNNSDSDTDAIGLFVDSFESGEPD